MLALLAFALVLGVTGESMRAEVDPGRATLASVSAAHHEAAGSRDTALPDTHADGVALDLDETSGDGRILAAAATAFDPIPALTGLRPGVEEAPREVRAKLPERPPRA